MPRWLLKSSCGLQRFLRSILTMRGQCPTSKSSCTWPMALPYPEVFRAGGNLDARSHMKRLLCFQVLVLDWLHLDKPDAAPACLRLGEHLSARQWTVVRMLEHLAFDGNTPELVDAADMGRAAGKVEGYEDSLAALSRAVSTLQTSEGRYYGSRRLSSDDQVEEETKWRCGKMVGSVTEDSEIHARPLVADRLNFPPKPCFDPLPYFDKSTAVLYERPLSEGRPLADVGKAPKVQVRASVNEKLKLYKKMAACGLLQPLSPGTYLDKYRSGLFAVLKDSERDRMILDVRPANMVSRGQKKWCYGMASASSLAGIYIEPDKVLMASGEDLRDYFYQFKVGHERTARNVLHGDLTLQQAREVFGHAFDWPTASVAVGLSSLAMGDCCAVEFAQCSHLSLMLQHGVARASELLTLHGAVPRGLLQIGVIVDDLVILEQVLRTSVDAEGKVVKQSESHARQAAARKAYADAKLLTNPKKSFECELTSNFWGIDLDGMKGLLRASQRRLWPCMVITFRVCALGLTTVSLLESLVGM
eukprot:s4220_g3.t1